MGILNLTPDSFSDGGEFSAPEKAVARALQMIQQGADIIDLGGESTRPGAEAVSINEEIRRVIPVIQQLRSQTDALISIDTSKAEVASRAVEAGADIINDVTGLRDEEMISVCQDCDCGIVLMHMQGDPRTMQQDPSYGDTVSEIRTYFTTRYQELVGRGIQPERLVFDPGIGFGKTLEHNLELLRRPQELVIEGRPLLYGLSRKSFLRTLLSIEEPSERDHATAIMTAMLRQKGVFLHRVHEIPVNLSALLLAESTE